MREKIDDFDKYPFALDVIRQLDSIKFHPKVTFIIGENGTGKSTLLEAIAIAYGFNPEGGTKNFQFSTRNSHSELYKYIRLVKGYRRPKDGFFLRAESYFNLGTEIEKLDEEPLGGPPIINSYGKRSLHEQSHGESFSSLMKYRFSGEGFYILDEPEAALSPIRQMAMLTRMHELVNKQSQFIIATHSPIILSYPEADIYEIINGKIYKSSYEETEHFSITRDFLNSPNLFLESLLN